MAQIIKIDNDEVIVAIDDVPTVTAKTSDFNFEIQECMEIDAHHYNDQYIFSPKFKAIVEEPKTQVNSTKNPYAIDNNVIYVRASVYVTLFVLFWPLGIHEFYARNPKKGICWIVATLIVTTVGALSDLSILPKVPHLFMLYNLFMFICFICMLFNNFKDGKIGIKKW